MHRPRIVLGAIVIALMATGTAFAAIDGGKANGGAAITTSGGFQAHRSFNAQGTPTSAKGQIETKLVDPATGEKVGQFHGVVDCYRQTGPNSAIFGGRVTDFQGKAGDVQDFAPYFEWAVVDNGEGAKATGPDMFGAGRFDNPPKCDAGDVLPVRPVESGNIQVKADK
jgi:hypothetical protein